MWIFEKLTLYSSGFLKIKDIISSLNMFLLNSITHLVVFFGERNFVSIPIVLFRILLLDVSLKHTSSLWLAFFK